MKSFFDVMRQPMSSPQKLMTLLQEQQMDTVETSVKALGCRDPMSLASLQQEYIARMLQRWTTLANEGAAAPQPQPRSQPQPRPQPQPRTVETRPTTKQGSATNVTTPPPATTKGEQDYSAIHDVAVRASSDAPKQPATPAAQPMPKRDDDLTQIKGIGPKFAQTLKEHGITSYAKLASLTPGEIEALEEKLGFSGRFERENWVEQARALIAH